MTQYSKRMVIVHWLTLIVVIAAWWFGDSAHDARHEKVVTLADYAAHLIAGAAVLLLVAVRLFFRSQDGVPAPMGDTPMDKVAKGVHHLLYTLLFLIPVTGVLQAVSSGIGKALMAGDATLLPQKIGGFVHESHEVLVNVLIAAVVVHILGALKHQFVMKDGLMERMSLRRKD